MAAFILLGFCDIFDGADVSPCLRLLESMPDSVDWGCGDGFVAEGCARHAGTIAAVGTRVGDPTYGGTGSLYA